MTKIKEEKNTRKTAINRRFWNTNETYGKIIHQFYYKFIMIQNWNAIFQCSINAATLSVGRFINYNDFLLNFCDHTLIRQPTVYDFMTNLSKYRNQSWKLWIFNEMVLFGVVDHLLIQWKKKNKTIQIIPMIYSWNMWNALGSFNLTIIWFCLWQFWEPASVFYSPIHSKVCRKNKYTTIMAKNRFVWNTKKR